MRGERNGRELVRTAPPDRSSPVGRPHAMRPGITGLAQVRGLRGATDTTSAIEKRVEADLEYINNWSIWLDLKILLQTIRVVMHPNAF